MPAKIPARQTLSGDGGNKLYVPSDGEGNALVTGNLTVNGKIIGDTTLNVASSADIAGSLVVNGDSTTTNLFVNADANITGRLTATNLVVTNSETAPTYIATGVPGFVGDGSGLINLPPGGGLGPPTFFVQSTLLNFGILTPNRFVPEIEPPLPAITLIMSVEMSGKPPGLYFWKTDANILLQEIWNSASGLVYWDGTKVSGQTTWSLVQDLSILNPEYFLTWSYLSASSLTKFDVQMESSYITLPINIAQPTSYYINVYKLFSA